MKYFVVEGTITNADLMNDNIMKEHMAYSQKAMDEGLILMSGLKEDMSGGLFVMKAESPKTLEIYLNNEPLKVYNIQEYKVIEFSPHYFNQYPNEWFNK
ncbi:Uncharacterised protein [uncultured Clostridium sp.]|uniref:YciI family protein n=1 Tax=uncultured Clostridium sp. TaxID=59620 RepID=UPI000821D457|nr:YciI family protein [uncultured Clostridium sp.]SCK03216.1 Uncharacterised protein [uncultured Clostridium sp.]